MSIQDVIKNDVYEKFAGGSGMSYGEIFIILGVSCLVGIYIYFIYKNFAKTEFYSRDLNITIAGLSVVVAAIMIAMQSNLLVSLGMVGALSIVRFRTAIKSPIDLLYLFWSISAGIICGVGLYVLGAVLCIIMTLLIFILGKVPNARAPQLLVLRMAPDTDMAAVGNALNQASKGVKEKSTIVKNGEREVIYELTAKDSSALVTALSAISGVVSVNLLEHHGEVRV